MADSVDWGQTEQALKDKAGQWYDPSMLEDVKRNSSYDTGGGAADVDSWVDRIAAKSQLRADNEPNSTYEANGQGGVTVGPTGNVNYPTGPSTRGPIGTTYGSFGSGTSGIPNFGTPGTNIGSFSSYFSGTPWDQKANDLYGTLMGRAQQGLNVNAQDPTIANQVNAYKAQTERANTSYLDGLAEHRGPNGNIGTESRMMAENTGMGAGQLSASLVANEIQQRRNEIQNALAQQGSMLSEQQRLVLQQQLSTLDAAVRSQLGNRGMDIQSQLGNRGLDINQQLGLGQLNLGQQQLNSSNDQWASDFGANRTDRASELDWREKHPAGV